MAYFVYFLTGVNNKVLYIGRTETLLNRIQQHRKKFVKGFTEKYNLHKLVYYEAFENKLDAEEREYKLKRWRRDWKNKLIEKTNPGWEDLLFSLTQEIPDSRSGFRDVKSTHHIPHAKRSGI